MSKKAVKRIVLSTFLIFQGKIRRRVIEKNPKTSSAV
jgi:hypothetical protein